MLRSGANEQEWNGVGIVLAKELKEDLISVSRNSDPVMTIELGLEQMVVNIMCVCAPQGGYIDPDGVPNDGLTQRIGRNEVLKSNVITNEESRDNGNGWDSRRCVDVFGRRRD